jgi:hypothetical protein
MWRRSPWYTLVCFFAVCGVPPPVAPQAVPTVTFASLPVDAATAAASNSTPNAVSAAASANVSEACHRVDGIPYCGKYVRYAVNASAFGSQAAIQAASDRAFSDYLTVLQGMQPVFASADFDAEAWQVLCQAHIAYFRCLQLFPACISPTDGSPSFEVRGCGDCTMPRQRHKVPRRAVRMLLFRHPLLSLEQVIVPSH